MANFIKIIYLHNALPRYQRLSLNTLGHISLIASTMSGDTSYRQQKPFMLCKMSPRFQFSVFIIS